MIRERFDFSAERCLDMAAQLGMTCILAAGAFPPGVLAPSALAESFGGFCDTARKRGLRVELEFVPFWGVESLSAAWDIVRGAARPDSGLLIDTWFLHKTSRDLDADLRLLQEIPGERLASVQLADGRLEPSMDFLLEEARQRLFPGDGELALRRMLRAISARGGLRWIGTEIFGPAIDTLEPREAGRRSAAATRAVLRDVTPASG